MLLADKRHVQYDLQVNLLGLRQKEIMHFARCCDTLSQPAALLAGFAYVGIAVSVWVPRGTHWLPEVLYYAFTCASMVFLVHVTVRATMIAVLGQTVALRGRDPASAHRAAEEMEFLFVGMWARFALGSFCWIASTFMRVYIQVNLTLAILLMAGITAFMLGIVRDFFTVANRFSISTDEIERGRFSAYDAASMRFLRSPADHWRAGMGAQPADVPEREAADAGAEDGGVGRAKRCSAGSACDGASKDWRSLPIAQPAPVNSLELIKAVELSSAPGCGSPTRAPGSGSGSGGGGCGGQRGGSSVCGSPRQTRRQLRPGVASRKQVEHALFSPSAPAAQRAAGMGSCQGDGKDLDRGPLLLSPPPATPQRPRLAVDVGDGGLPSCSRSAASKAGGPASSSRFTSPRCLPLDRDCSYSSYCSVGELGRRSSSRTRKGKARSRRGEGVEEAGGRRRARWGEDEEPAAVVDVVVTIRHGPRLRCAQQQAPRQLPARAAGIASNGRDGRGSKASETRLPTRPALATARYPPSARSACSRIRLQARRSPARPHFLPPALEPPLSVFPRRMGVCAHQMAGGAHCYSRRGAPAGGGQLRHGERPALLVSNPAAHLARAASAGSQSVPAAAAAAEHAASSDKPFSPPPALHARRRTDLPPLPRPLRATSPADPAPAHGERCRHPVACPRARLRPPARPRHHARFLPSSAGLGRRQGAGVDAACLLHAVALGQLHARRVRPCVESVRSCVLMRSYLRIQAFFFFLFIQDNFPFIGTTAVPSLRCCIILKLDVMMTMPLYGRDIRLYIIT